MNDTSRATFAAHFDRCEVTRERDTLTGRFHIAIAPIWKDVDRPDVGGWRINDDARLAERLRRAVESGAAFTNVEGPLRDVNGRTYINAAHAIIGRRMNADLKRVGF